MKQCVAFLALLALLAEPAGAIVVSRITEFEAGTPVIADDLNAEIDNILSAINGNLSSENLVDQAVATDNLAAYSVTKIKLGPLDEEISAPSGVAERGLQTLGNVPNLTANITVLHRPVWVGLQPAAGTSLPGSVTYRNNGSGATNNKAFVAFTRTGTIVNQTGFTSRNITTSTDDVYISLPCSAFWFLDDPGAGPHNYTAQFRVATADDGTVVVENCKLVVFEL